MSQAQSISAALKPPSSPLIAALAPVSALLASVGILLMGNGLQSMLVPLRANMEAFQPLELGLLGTAYFIGFTLGCLQGPLVVRRAGHIRAFAAMTSVASAVPLLHAINVEPVAWWLLRGITGFCFAVLYIIIESWLNARSDNATRGTVFSVYTIVNLTVITAGQMMIGLADPGAFTLFAAASILVSLAALPIVFTISASPAPAQYVRPRILRLYAASPVGVTGCFAVGLANGAFWALGPVFAQNRGLEPSHAGFFMSAVVLGGALAQWPLGRLSDRVDRRLVMIVASLISAAAGAAMMLMPNHDTASLILAGALFGMGAFPLYVLAVAHANDHVEPGLYVETSSGLLLIYGLGAAAGPLLASLLGEASTTPTLFIFTAVVHVLFAGYVAWRMTQRRQPAREERVEFIDAVIAAQTVSAVEPVSLPSPSARAEQPTEHAEAA